MNYYMFNKRYFSLTEYYLKKYGSKVARVPLNGNLTCPNRDGKKGYGGCIYCSDKLSGDLAGDKSDDLLTQFNKTKIALDKKWPNLKYIPYLQAGSNTYASLDKLKEIYEPLLSLDNIVALSIATRADCFNEEIYQYLGELNKKIPLEIELGLQTSNAKTANLINRQLDNEDVILCVKRLRSLNIDVVIHIINGLMNEDENDMLETINFLNKLDIQGIKIHSLLVLKNSMLYQEYLKKPFKILSLEEYVDITVKQIEHLRKDIAIFRVQADSKEEDLFEPKWALKKLVVMNEIDKLLRKKDTYQGISYSNE